MSQFIKNDSIFWFHDLTFAPHGQPPIPAPRPVAFGTREMDDSGIRLEVNGPWVEGARLECTRRHGGRLTDQRHIVIHYTANGSTQATINAFKRLNVSAHFVIGRGGEIIQMVPLNRKAWHAGRSSWKGLTSLNNHSIGIELVNYGYRGEHVPSGVNTQGWILDRHRNGGPFRNWQPYTAIQMVATRALCRTLMRHFAIPAEDVLGHEEISPDRKVDPGPAFGMQKFRLSLG